MKTIIKNGKVVTAGDCFIGDIIVENEIIKELGINLKGEFDNVIDATDKVVMPGGVDVHTHMNLHTGTAVSCDDFYSGTVAAACGGTTCIVDHMGFGPSGCSLNHQLKVYHEYAREKAVIDYGFHGVIQHVNDDIIEQLKTMVEDEGVPSFKIYMTYDFKIGDAEALRFMEKLNAIGGITAVHAENDEIINYLKKKYVEENKKSPEFHPLSRPRECEGEAVERITKIAELAGNAPLYIVHLTTDEGLQNIKRARDNGQTVFSETCPQYLLLNEDKYSGANMDGLKYIMSPPLRSKSDSEALWKGISDGTIQVIATDHCPFQFLKDKMLGRDDFTKCPNGAPGVEERIPLIFSEGVMKGKISLNKFVEVCCTNPAKLFGLYPRKGNLMPGSDADIVIIDSKKEVTLKHYLLHGRADYSAYEGIKLKGYPVLTMSRGEVIVKDNEFIGHPGRGEYVKRKAVFNKSSD